ncbi:MAG: hydroxymethylbilane synthase [Deltaproteobacteria bacterium]|nr:hydroxymethylbilane synthase [Deltaproteobacteria bacterium]
MAGRLRLGTRGSALALRQTTWVADALRARWPALDIEVIPIRTSGDRLVEVSLAQFGGKGLFVKEIEEALLEGRIDVAVHSAKDLPMELAPGLVLVATSTREDPRDVLIAREGYGLRTLPTGARVGTSSLRRQAQLLHVRPDLRITPLRGNLDTRLRKLEQEGLDALVVAAAGVRRLGLEARITEWLGPELCLPAAGQGALGLEGRAGDERVRDLVAPLDHPPSATAVAAERAFVRRLGAGCHVSLAAFAEVGETIGLQGVVLSPDGKTVLRDALRGPRDTPEALGVALAERLLAQGAERVLAESAPTAAR